MERAIPKDRYQGDDRPRIRLPATGFYLPISRINGHGNTEFSAMQHRCWLARHAFL